MSLEGIEFWTITIELVRLSCKSERMLYLKGSIVKTGGDIENKKKPIIIA